MSWITQCHLHIAQRNDEGNDDNKHYDKHIQSRPHNNESSQPVLILSTTAQMCLAYGFKSQRIIYKCNSHEYLSLLELVGSTSNFARNSNKIINLHFYIYINIIIE